MLVVVEEPGAVGEAGIGARIGRIQLHCLVEHALCEQHMLRRVQMKEMAALEIVVVGVDVLRGRRLDRLPFAWQQLDLELIHDRLRDFVLDGEDVGQISVVAIGPEVRSLFCIDQLGVDADAIARLSNAALENVGDVEAPTHLLHIGVLASCR